MRAATAPSRVACGASAAPPRPASPRRGRASSALLPRARPRRARRRPTTTISPSSGSPSASPVRRRHPASSASSARLLVANHPRPTSDAQARPSSWAPSSPRRARTRPRSVGASTRIAPPRRRRRRRRRRAGSSPSPGAIRRGQGGRRGRRTRSRRRRTRRRRWCGGRARATCARGARLPTTALRPAPPAALACPRNWPAPRSNEAEAATPETTASRRKAARVPPRPRRWTARGKCGVPAAGRGVGVGAAVGERRRRGERRARAPLRQTQSLLEEAARVDRRRGEQARAVTSTSHDV